MKAWVNYFGPPEVMATDGGPEESSSGDWSTEEHINMCAIATPRGKTGRARGTADG